MFDGAVPKPKRRTPEWEDRHRRLIVEVLAAVDCWMISRNLAKTKPDLGLDLAFEEALIESAAIALNDFLCVKYPWQSGDV